MQVKPGDIALMDGDIPVLVTGTPRFAVDVERVAVDSLLTGEEEYPKVENVQRLGTFTELLISGLGVAEWIRRKMA